MVGKNRLKGDLNCMTKTIKIILTEDNSIKIICENRVHDIVGNSITSLEIYNLLNYNFGDKYSVELVEEGSKTEIVRPIKEMFDVIVGDIDIIKLPKELIDEDIEELNEDQKVTFVQNIDVQDDDLPF